MKKQKKNTHFKAHRRTITLLAGLMFIFFIPLISGFEFDNLKSYDEETKTITITNSFLLLYPLGEVATIKLDTPLVYNVIRGEDRLVAEFTINNIETYTEGVFDDMEFYDTKNNMEKFDRNFNYKYKTFYDVEVLDYETICKEKEVIGINGTYIEKYDCSKNLAGSHIEQRIKWNDFNEKVELLKGEIIIGVFTDVFKGDSVEWIPTLFGVKINEWAVWTESLNVDLVAYWDFEEGSGSEYVDRVTGLYNLSLQDNANWTTAKVGSYSAGFDGNSDYATLTNLDIGGFSEITWCVWGYAKATNKHLVVGVGDPIGSNLLHYNIDGNTKLSMGTYGGVSDVTAVTDGVVNLNSWQFFCATAKENDYIRLYVNGSEQGNVSMTTFGNLTSTLHVGCNVNANSLWWDGMIDEFGYWNRSLTSSEINDLYNDGNGMTYTGDFVPAISITYPENITYNKEITELNYTVQTGTGDSCWYSLDLGVTNSSRQDWGINWTGLSSTEGSNTWTVYCNNTLNNVNSSSVTFTIDTTFPTINITHPENITYTTNVSDLNYTYTELNCDSVWYSLDLGITNSSRENCGTNWTGLSSTEGSNTWNVYINDTFNNVNSSSVTFFKDSILPDISIIYPTNNSNHSINTIDINYTVSDTNLDSCWYSNDTMSLNTTIICGTNITTITWSEGQHNVTIWANDTFNNVNSSSVTFTIDTTLPTINITHPTAFINNHAINTNLTFNWTVSDTNLDSCWGIYGGTNTTITCNDLNISLLISNYSDRTFSFYVNDTFGNVANDSVTWNYYVFENNQTFNNDTMEGNLETFLANIFKHSSVTISKVILIYNSTNYTGESYTEGDSTILRKQNLLVPSITADINKTFYWDLILSNGVRLNLTDNNQTILNLGMDNCTTYTTRILNLTVYDEELQTLITNATIETAVNLYSSDRSTLILNVSGTYANPTGICLSLNLSSDVIYSLDTVIKYEATGYATEYYNIVNFTLTNNTETQGIILYDLNSSDSTGFQLTFTGSDFLVVENALVYVNRQYIAENKFKTVELPKTDSNGQTILNLVRNTIVYNMVVIKNGVTLGTFNNIIAFCEDYSIGDCKITLNAFDSVEEIFDYDSALGITFNPPLFNSTTRIITFNFLSTDGTPKDVLMNVTRNDIFGNRTVCEDSLTSAGGTLTCTVNPNIDESILRISVYVDGVDTASSTVQLDSSNYGVGGYLVFFVMAITFILIFSESKTGVLIGIILAFVSAVGMNLISDNVIGDGASGVWLILIILLAIWKLNKERIQ